MSTTANNPTKLTEVRSDTEAAIIVAALEQHGIEAHLTGEYTACFRAEAPGNVSILINQTDLAEARQVLTQFVHQDVADDTNETADISHSIWRTFSLRLLAIGLVITIGMYGIWLIGTLFQVLTSFVSSLV